RGERRDGEGRLNLEQARSRRLRLAEPDGQIAPAPRPSFLGTRAFGAYPLEELVERIDWTPFFTTWELKGHYPEIFDDPRLGASARELYDDARQMLDRLLREGELRASAVVGFWPAASTVDDDILLYPDEGRR